MSWFYDNRLAYLYLIRRNLCLPTISYHQCRLRSQIHQLGDSIRSPVLGSGFHIFSNGDQCQDHGCRFKIKIHGCHMCYIRLAAPHGISHHIQAADTVDKCCRGTHSHQSVHIRCSVEQRLKSVLIVFPVQIHDRKCQEQLSQCKYHHILMSKQNARQWPSQHMSHGNVHEYNQKYNRPAQTMLHLFGFFCCPLLQIILCFFRRLMGILDRCTISCILHCMNDRCRIGGFIFIFHHHGILQQIDLHLIHARNPAHSLLHMGTACTAAHAGHIKLLLHFIYISSLKSY